MAHSAGNNAPYEQTMGQNGVDIFFQCAIRKKSAPMARPRLIPVYRYIVTPLYHPLCSPPLLSLTLSSPTIPDPLFQSLHCPLLPSPLPPSHPLPLYPPTLPYGTLCSHLLPSTASLLYPILPYGPHLTLPSPAPSSLPSLNTTGKDRPKWPFRSGQKVQEKSKGCNVLVPKCIGAEMVWCRRSFGGVK